MRSTAGRANERTLDRSPPENLPSPGEWDEEAYLRQSDRTNRLVELTKGHMEVLPMPTDEHQSILAYLFEVFSVFLRGSGKVLFAPLRLRIREGVFREPDLLLLVDARDPRRQNRYWRGADLVVEIVSPDRPERDLIDKRLDYASAAIPEYWIVDPRIDTVSVLRLVGEGYACPVPTSEAGQRESAGM